MKYARIENNLLVEFIEVEGDPVEMYPPWLIWVNISDITYTPDYYWVWDGTIFSPPVIPIEDARRTKTQEMRARCEEEITRKPFSSSALGAIYNYDCRLIDQVNLNIRCTVSTVSQEGEPVWASDGTRYAWVEHTPLEIIQVLTDMNEHIKENQLNLAAKLAAVDAATSSKQVQDIIW